MLLGETIATYDVDLALRGESGKFEVISPQGETYYVNCQPNSLGSNTRLSEQQPYPQAFLVRKIAESLALEQSSRRPMSAEPAIPAAEPLAPFLLASTPGRNELADESASGALQDELEGPRTWSLELAYSDDDPEAELPCASVRVTGTDADGQARALTTECRSFNELDTEIRKLNAQLEDIRLQAKKKFYKARAAAASA